MSEQPCDEQGRPLIRPAGSELETLLGFLEFQRATLEWKTRGLGSDGLSARVGASTMTLGGLLKHMALVEEHWFWRSLHDGERQPPWDAVDWTARPDWEWETAADDTPEQLRELWQGAVERSRALLAEALQQGDLGQLAKRPWGDGVAPSLRWILTHMIEEYARHNGHADLLRELVDGETGE